jgi:GNAT superfamily N-acetyltransferase
MNQVVLYIYSFPTYLQEQPRVKIGRTSGSAEAEPQYLAMQRIRAQIKTSHPEEPQLLGAVPIPGEWVERTIHSQLKEKGYHVTEAPGIEWFRFPNQERLQEFIDKLYRAVIIDDFSELGGGRQDIEGDSFESIIAAFGVRTRNGEEFRGETELIKVLYDELSPLYPGFSKWLEDSMRNPKTVFNVAYRNNQAIGVAVWKPKGNRIAKLSTLFVTEDYRQSGIGRNLILTCFQQWREVRIRRAFVTTAKVDLVSFFERYGFSVEGVGREIYEREGHQLEWFLTKLFFYDSDNADLDTVSKAQILFPPLISTSYNPNGRDKVEQVRCSNAKISLCSSDGELVNQFPLHTWLNLTYPAESTFSPKIAYIIPIHPQFLIQIFQAGKTVYYGKFTCKDDDMRGASILFYASSPISGVVATARIKNRYVGTPTELYGEFGRKGVLNLQEIGNQNQQRQAIEFDYLTPLRQVISRDDLIINSILRGHPQAMHSISLGSYRRATELGGFYAG